MKFVRLLASLSMIVSIGATSAERAPTAIASSGETAFTAMTGDLKVRVTVKTHEVMIGKPSDSRPTVIESSCTFSRFPCSVVDRIDISVNGVALFVPRSAFCDLADLSGGEVRADKKQSTLTLYGGDASESYIVTIGFDSTGVKHRRLASRTSPRQPLQETVYHSVADEG